MDGDIVSNISTLTLDDLQEEYKKLLLIYQHSTKVHEDDLQQIYELQRNVKISKAAEQHLAQELDIISTSQNFHFEKLNKKLNRQLEELKRKVIELEDYNDILEKKLDATNSENHKLQEQLYEISASLKGDDFSNTNQAAAEQQEKLEAENLELLSKLNELQDQNQKNFMIMAEKERQTEVLREEIRCYKENLYSKRTEVEEKTTICESLQEKVIELNSELASLKLQPGVKNSKGNSLFAEVYDQRQQMESQLLAQKESYLQMKKIYNDSQYEIRRLKRENSAMQSEIQACSSIFLNSKKFFEDKLVNRISFLTKERDDLEKKLNISEDRLSSLADKNEITWLDSMMAFCKNETKDLKTQLQNIRLQKGIIEKNYRDSQEELAKWRFEALKLRCILIDRESLLDENSIKYKGFFDMNIKLKEEEISNCIPQIMCSSKEFNNKIEETKISDVAKNSNIDSNVYCSNALDFEKQENFMSTKSKDECLFVSTSAIPKISQCSEESVDKNLNNFTNSQINHQPDICASYIVSGGGLKSKLENVSKKTLESYEDVECTHTKSGYIENNLYEIEKQDKENKSISLNKSNATISILNNQSIFDKLDQKSVNFELDHKIENQDTTTMKVITKRTKSNITIKKIVIKSKEKMNSK